MSTSPERNLTWIARVLRVLVAPFVRFDIRGGRCIRGGRGAAEHSVGIVAVNHRSMFDVVAGLICLDHFGHHPRILIERQYLESRWTGPFARAIGAIPVDRERGGGTSYRAAIATLQSGVPLVLLPEGRLHWDPDDPRSIGPTRTGISRIAVASGMPVLPAALSGTEQVMPAHARLPRLNPFRRKTVVCNVADDVMWVTGDDHRRNTDEIMEAVRQLLV